MYFNIPVLLQCPQSELDLDLVRMILGESKIHNADITLREDATAEDLIDVVEGNRVYVPAIYVLNKIDQIPIEVCKVLSPRGPVNVRELTSLCWYFSEQLKTKLAETRRIH